MTGGKLNPLRLPVTGGTGGDHHLRFFGAGDNAVNPSARLDALLWVADFIEAVKEEKCWALLQPAREVLLFNVKIVQRRPRNKVTAERCVVSILHDEVTEWQKNHEQRLSEAKLLPVVKSGEGIVLEQRCLAGTGVANNEQQPLLLKHKAHHLLRLADLLIEFLLLHLFLRRARFAALEVAVATPGIGEAKGHKGVGQSYRNIVERMGAKKVADIKLPPERLMVVMKMVTVEGLERLCLSDVGVQPFREWKGGDIGGRRKECGIKRPHFAGLVVVAYREDGHLAALCGGIHGAIRPLACLV